MSDPEKKKTSRKRKASSDLGKTQERIIANSTDLTMDQDDGYGEELSPKRKLFVENLVFVHMLNGTRAYMDTYGTRNQNSANACAARLLGIASVRAYRDELMTQALESRRSELEYIFVNVNKEIVTAQISDYINEEGEVSLDLLKNQNPRAVKEVTTTILYTKAGDEVITRKFKLEGKQKSLEMLSRYLRLGEEDKNRAITIQFSVEESGL
ncbi:terminase small subunit [Leptospira santarosai]|uniref:Terminase small subunit n=1 Tax=Leptospira santarosai str. ZUN179 TaxID=1049985 RepID=M6UGV3_9LEPT|nr:terminase small subunit [Leptospira santarosai]EMO43780.1 terminase small subunit [Leptospira santarosai str. ZUN179]